jgi:eukaryotic-like serine/threonine-protein kinase
MLDAGHRLSPSQALLVGLEAARALDVAHRRGFVHRDIKPANLLFGDDARLRVADFGLARAIAEAAWTEPQGAVLGTARYATPEQARGEAVDGRADVYSLAVVLVEAVTGQVPFAADTTIATLMGRIGKDMVVPDELGPLRKCLERAGRADPSERPDAGELAVSLMAAAEQLPRPDPLPLVGLGGVDAAAPGGADDPDRTVLGLATGTGAPGGQRIHEDVDATVVAAGASVDDGAGADPTGDQTAVGVARGGVDDPLGEGDGEDLETAIAWVDSDPDDVAAPVQRRRRWPVLALVVVLAAVLGGVGAFAYQQVQTPTYEVPVLTGLQEDAARRLVDGNGWRIEVRQDREDGTAPGQVLRTEPVAGERIAEGGTLVLHVSLGNTLSTVPGDLVGLPVEEAEAALEEAGFVPIRSDEHSEDVPAGVVISVPEDLPAQMPRGEEVELVVSSGPAPARCPTTWPGSRWRRHGPGWASWGWRSA